MPGNLSEPCGEDCLEWAPKDTTHGSYPHLEGGLEDGNAFKIITQVIIQQRNSVTKIE